MTEFRKLKLVEEQELLRLITKQLREYDPALRSMAAMKVEMDNTLNRSDLSPDEKIALLKGSQQRFAQLKGGATVNDTSSEETTAPSATHPLTTISGSAPPRGKQFATDSAIEAMLNPDPEPFLSPQTEGELGTPTKASTSTTATSSSSSFSTTTPTSSAQAGVVSEPAFNPRFIPIVEPKHKQQLNLLISMIEKAPHILAPNQKTGELTVAGKTLPGSSFHDLFKSLYEKEDEGKQNLTGQSEFLVRIGALLRESGEEIKLRNLVPRYSHYELIKKGLGLQTGQSEPKEGKSQQAGKGLSPKRPPGKPFRVLYLYS